MRLIAIHDSYGRINAVVASPPDSPIAGLAAKAGEFVTELDVSDIELDFSDPQANDRLTELAAGHLVEFTKGKLLRKTD